MRWGYKTVQYGLKKEGLLGGSFLDEAEVEQSLNEFGQAGWELVSMFPMHDGLMAVFRQELEQKVTAVQEPVAEPVEVPQRFSLRPQSMEVSGAPRKIGQREQQPVVAVHVEKETVSEDEVGGIRIE